MYHVDFSFQPAGWKYLVKGRTVFRSHNLKITSRTCAWVVQIYAVYCVRDHNGHEQLSSTSICAWALLVWARITSSQGGMTAKLVLSISSLCLQLLKASFEVLFCVYLLQMHWNAAKNNHRLKIQNLDHIASHIHAMSKPWIFVLTRWSHITLILPIRQVKTINLQEITLPKVN